MYSASRVYSVNSVYSVFYSVYSVIYSVIIINSANTLNIVFYSVYSVRYSDLFKLVYSVLLFINSISRLLGELNGIELTNVDLSRGRS